MSQPAAVYQWTHLIARQFPHLRASQAKVLAAFSWGVVASRRCTLRLVAEALPQLGKPDTVERRLQRFVANPRVDWQAGATALARWVLSRFPARRPLVLLVDETSLHEALRVMVVSVAYRGRALPVAWSCYPSGGCGQGQVEVILALLDHLAPAFPAQSRVLIQADRGIGTSPRLLAALAARGWYFLVRVQRQVRVRRGAQSGAIGALVSQPGHQWQGPGAVFKKAGWYAWWVIASWPRGRAEPWLLVSNWPRAQHAWYRQRMWEEAAFRDLKSSGWQWQRSQIRSPAHANRLWLVLALATAWMSSLGTRVLRSPRLRRALLRGRRLPLSVFQLGLRFFTRWHALGRRVVYDVAGLLHFPRLPKTVVP